MERIEISLYRSRQLRKALFFYLAAALMVLVLSLAVTISFTLFGRLKDAEDNSIVYAAQTRAMTIDEWCRRAKDLALQITSRTRIRQELEKYNHGKVSYEVVKSFTEPKLQDAINLSKNITGILRLDANHRIIAACGYGADLPVTDKTVEKYIFNDIDLLEPLTIKGQLSIVVSAPIRNRNGERQGTDLVVFDADGLRSIVSNAKPIGRTSSIIIGYQSNGDIAYLYPQNREAIKALSRLDSFNAVKASFHDAMAGQTGIKSVSHTLVAYTPVMETNWGLVITQGKDELYLPLYRQMANIGFLFLMIYLLTLLGFWFVTKPLAGRILLHAKELERTIEEKTTGLEQEIDRRTELEKLLREKERFLNSVFDAIQDGICVLSPDLKIIYTNKAMKTWYKEHLPLENKTCFEVYHQLQHPCPECPSLRSINSRKIEMQEAPLVQKGCEVGVQELYAFPLYDEDNKLKGVVEYIRDISLRKRAEEALKVSEGNMASVLNNTKDGIVRIDRNFRHIFANPAVYAATGLSPEQYLGKTNEEIGMPEDLCTFWREIHEGVFRNRNPKTVEYTFMTANRGERFIQAIVTPEFDEDKEVATIICVFRDITELKNAESEKNAVIAKLEKALAEIRTLQGFIPICASCKNIRDDKGYWQQIEHYIQDRSDAQFSHSLCPKCAKKLYPDMDI